MGEIILGFLFLVVLLVVFYNFVLMMIECWPAVVAMLGGAFLWWLYRVVTGDIVLAPETVEGLRDLGVGLVALVFMVFSLPYVLRAWRKVWGKKVE